MPAIRKFRSSVNQCVAHTSYGEENAAFIGPDRFIFYRLAQLTLHPKYFLLNSLKNPSMRRLNQWGQTRLKSVGTARPMESDPGDRRSPKQGRKMSPEEKIKDIEKKITMVGIIDMPGSIMLGLSLAVQRKEIL